MDNIYSALRSIPLRRGPKRVVAGVAGGIAEKFGWDVSLVRIGMLLSFLLPVIGIGLYLVMWLLLPYRDDSIVLQRILTRK